MFSNLSSASTLKESPLKLKDSTFNIRHMATKTYDDYYGEAQKKSKQFVTNKPGLIKQESFVQKTQTFKLKMQKAPMTRQNSFNNLQTVSQISLLKKGFNTAQKQTESNSIIPQASTGKPDQKSKTGDVMKHTKSMSYFEILNEKRKVEEQIKNIYGTGNVPKTPLFCTPNCQHSHHCNYQYDYSKNYKDPLIERPGVCFTCDVDQTPLANLDTKNIVGEMGCHQSPINLDTDLEISQFKDDEFKFNYEKIKAKESMKFNEEGDAFYFKMNDNNLPEENQESWLQTKTISLFDKHIEKASLYGMQYHFHSPSEHSINGQLMDLEMHIVHKMENQYTGNVKNGSQFSNGVLGFIFKCVPESFFEELAKKVPAEEVFAVDFHDKALSQMVDYEIANQESFFALKSETAPIDMHQFVSLLDFNRRWTYQGSLTTIPCSEGILWNVIEEIIPIRQSTLDKFNQFRKIEEHQYTNRINNDPTKGAVKKPSEWQATAKDFEYPINGNSCRRHGNQFMRVAVCNRKVLDQDGRDVFHISKTDKNPNAEILASQVEVQAPPPQVEEWQVQAKAPKQGMKSSKFKAPKADALLVKPQQMKTKFKAPKADAVIVLTPEVIAPKIKTKAPKV